jgi:hypothetical protein
MDAVAGESSTPDPTQKRCGTRIAQQHRVV